MPPGATDMKSTASDLEAGVASHAPATPIWKDPVVIGAVVLARTVLVARLDRLGERRKSDRRNDRYASRLAAARVEMAQLAAPTELT